MLRKISRTKTSEKAVDRCRRELRLPGRGSGERGEEQKSMNDQEQENVGGILHSKLPFT